jgi:hypothetical protein
LQESFGWSAMRELFDKGVVLLAKLWKCARICGSGSQREITWSSLGVVTVELSEIACDCICEFVPYLNQKDT